MLTPPKFQLPTDLGHFALTGLLLGNLLPVEGSRVVVVSSKAHKFRAKIDVEDLQWEHRRRGSRARGVYCVPRAIFSRIAKSSRDSPLMSMITLSMVPVKVAGDS